MQIPTIVQIILGVLSTAFFIWLYVKSKELYQLLFAIWIPSLFLKYVSADRNFQIALGIFQLILFALVSFSLLKARAKSKKALKEQLKQDELEKQEAEKDL